MTEHACGSVHRVPACALAARAAQHVLAYKTARAVALDPDGRVIVEPVHGAAEADVVGVYARGLGVLELTRRITEDLRHEIEARQLRPRVARRHRVTGAVVKHARGSA